MKLTSERSSLDTLFGPGETWSYKSTPTTQKDNGTNLQDKGRMYLFFDNIQSWSDAKASKKGELKRDGKNMHFIARAASQKMMELIRSASESAAIVLTPGVSELVSLSRAHVVDDLTDCACWAEGHLSAQASTVDCNLSTTCAQAADDDLQQNLDKVSTEAVVDKANVVGHSEGQNPEAKLGQSKNEFLSTALVWKCRARKTLRSWFGWARARTTFKIFDKLRRQTPSLWERQSLQRGISWQDNWQQEMSHWKSRKTLSRTFSHWG